MSCEFELLTRLSARVMNTASAAAASSWVFLNDPGVYTRIQECVCYHDDPAGATLSWRVFDWNTTTAIDVTIGAVAVNVRTRLSSYFPVPLYLPPEWGLYIVASGALAAGKKLYLETFYHSMRGIPAGVQS